MYISIDGVQYDVVYKRDARRQFNFVDGRNGGVAADYSTILDTVGTEIVYEFEVDPNPTKPLEYDAFVEHCASPRRKHMFELPHGAQGSISFDGYVESLSDALYGDDPGSFSTETTGTVNRWHGCRVVIRPIKPQWMADDIAFRIKSFEPEESVVWMEEGGVDLTWDLEFGFAAGTIGYIDAQVKFYVNGNWTPLQVYEWLIPPGETSLSTTLTLESVRYLGYYNVQIVAWLRSTPEQVITGTGGEIMVEK